MVVNQFLSGCESDLTSVDDFDFTIGILGTQECLKTTWNGSLISSAPEAPGRRTSHDHDSESPIRFLHCSFRATESQRVGSKESGPKIRPNDPVFVRRPPQAVLRDRGK